MAKLGFLLINYKNMVKNGTILILSQTIPHLIDSFQLLGIPSFLTTSLNLNGILLILKKVCQI
jgi:hypothetical protein